MTNTKTRYEIDDGAMVWLKPDGFNCWLLEWIDYSPLADKVMQWCKLKHITTVEVQSEDAPVTTYSAWLSNIENYDLRLCLGVNTDILEEVNNATS